MIVIRTYSEYFAVFMSCFLVCDIMTLNRNFDFERDDTFKDLLPITGSVNYTETQFNLTRIECAGFCEYCTGFLYNRVTGTCHILKTRLDERDFNRSRVDIGWELYDICGQGWHLYKTHCYTYLELNKKWTEAKDICASSGAYLVQIETREENEWIKEHLLPALKKPESCFGKSNFFCCDTWIGASDQVEEKVFQWTNKENVVFTNWNPAEPNNKNGNEDCVSLCRDGQWNDYSCSKTFNFICERYISG